MNSIQSIKDPWRLRYKMDLDLFPSSKEELITFFAKAIIERTHGKSFQTESLKKNLDELIIERFANRSDKESCEMREFAEKISAKTIELFERRKFLEEYKHFFYDYITPADCCVDRPISSKELKEMKKDKISEFVMSGGSKQILLETLEEFFPGVSGKKEAVDFISTVNLGHEDKELHPKGM